ncbi:MAG: gamma carbonic anhydrase family protein [Methanomassiliicoccus sp.]|nr:gamma carbonic anhydrase family protein [Methanomassiliicoccus sp.]
MSASKVKNSIRCLPAIPFPEDGRVCRYIDPTAVLIGNYELEDGVSIWPYAVIRADHDRVVVGEGSNVQEHAVLHVDTGFPTIIGRNVTVGHGAIINRAKVGDHCIIGMNATVVEGAIISDDCIIGANAVVTGKMVIPSGSIVVGVPGRIVRSNDPTVHDRAENNARAYHALRDEHLAGRYARYKAAQP